MSSISSKTSLFVGQAAVCYHCTVVMIIQLREQRFLLNKIFFISVSWNVSMLSSAAKALGF